MAEGFLCDANCPRKALNGVYAREDMAAGRANFIKIGLTGAFKDIGRVLTCPSNLLTAETYRPQPKCVESVKKDLATRAINPEFLTPHDETILGPYLEPDTEPPQS